MSEAHIVTDHPIIKEWYKCSACGHEFLAYFVDCPAVYILECDCHKTAYIQADIRLIPENKQ